MIVDLHRDYNAAAVARSYAVIAHMPRAAGRAIIRYVKGLLKRHMDERLLNRTKLLLRALKQSR